MEVIEVQSEEEIRTEDEIGVEAKEDEDEQLHQLQQQQQQQQLVSKRSPSSVFIRSFKFGPEVPVRIDYSAKYVDLTQGALAGVLAGLASLNCSELTLKRVAYCNGILGFDKLLTILLTDWLADIRQNQVGEIMKGLEFVAFFGPMASRM